MTELARMFPCDSESKNLQNPVENVGIMWYTLFAAGIRASRSVGVGCWCHLKRNFLRAATLWKPGGFFVLSENSGVKNLFMKRFFLPSSLRKVAGEVFDFGEVFARRKE